MNFISYMNSIQFKSIFNFLFIDKDMHLTAKLFHNYVKIIVGKNKLSVLKKKLYETHRESNIILA